MDRIQNILVPVDLSDFSSRLIKISKWLSDRIDAHFHFVYIVDERMVFSFKHLDVDMRDNLFKISKEALEAIIKYSDFQEGKYSSEVFLGEPFVEIISKSTTRPPADLIIVGGVSIQGLHKIGDNAFKIIQMSPTHTLIIKEKDEGETKDEVKFNKVLLALDFSEHSIMALDYTISMKSIFNSNIHVFQVIGEKEEASEEKVKEQLKEHISAEKIKEIDSIEVVSSNNPAQTILDKIEEDQIDLLSIGSHSKRRFLRNLFLGKVAYQVVRKANCSVLVFKTPT